jgi:hypothetical protein
MSEWQPIKTAPKDGTPILIWHQSEGTHMVQWEEVTNDERQKGWCDGWYDIGTFCYLATHWMPLPEPPK